MASDRELVRLDAGGIGDMRLALRTAGLPEDDLRPEITSFFRLDDAAGPLGWAAVEHHGSEGLLRSVVVLDGRRGERLGTDLISRVIQAAADDRIKRLWLLTETAAPFFAKLGFTMSERESAPPAIRQTSEFLYCCPSSADCMAREL